MAKSMTVNTGAPFALPRRTRVKFCGMTRAEDVAFAVRAGVDAIGMVFYEKSPRCVTLEQAANLTRGLPPFVSAVGLFVNADEETVVAATSVSGLSLLQFHGDEDPARCQALGRSARLPWVRAIRVSPRTTAAELSDLQRTYAEAGAAGLVLDTLVESYGGSGHVFDWSCVPDTLGTEIILGGGLNEANVGEAIKRVRPYAVDVSSGIEGMGDLQARGVKDTGRMAAFVSAVREADTA